MKSLRRRGQAWIIYENLHEAKAAQEALHGHVVFGKKMRVSFSRNLSDKTRDKKGLGAREKTPREDRERSHDKKPVVPTDTTASFFSTSSHASQQVSRGYTPPNKVLLVENLSERTSVGDLETLFKRFEGFIEVRLIPSRGIGFVEFVDSIKSQTALSAMDGFELEPGRVIRVSNAK
jgi:U2 small nuclear ribonucleoprotein B''